MAPDQPFVVPPETLDDREQKLAAREQALEKLQQELEKRERKLETDRRTLEADRRTLDELEQKVAQREAKTTQRQKEVADGEAKRKEAERELRRQEAAIAERERKVKNREIEADADFERQNTASLAALEKQHASLRAQLAALQTELATTRAKELAKLDEDLSRERTQRRAALNEEIAAARAQDDGHREREAERERQRLAAHLSREEARGSADRERREQELAARESRQRESDDRAREAHQAEDARLKELERTLKQDRHQLRLDESTLRIEQAHLARTIEEKVRDRVAEVAAKLEAQREAAEERLRQILELERRLQAFEELQRRFPDQSPEEVLAERDRLRTKVDELREKLDARPSEEDKQRLDHLELENRRLAKELGNERQRRAELTAERHRWFTSVADLEQQRELREAEERRRDALEAQNRKLGADVDRLKALYEAPQDRTKRIASIEMPWYQKLVRANGDPELSELSWIGGIIEHCRASGMEFPRRLVLAFHTALKTSAWSPLAILAGVSGTGKSELPRLYARFGGLAFMPRPVQPNWDSPQSLFGFFNSLDNRFDSTPLLQALVQSQQDAGSGSHGFKDRLLLVLLDELNLAHVELYFSDLLSKLEERRGVERVDLDLELGGGEKYPLPLGRNVLWVGTMNEDETTKSLSDKVIDRSNLIYFPRPQRLQRRIDARLGDDKPLLPRETWERWIAQKSPFSDEEVRVYKETVERMNAYLERVGRALGHRVWQAIEHYMANHPEVIDARTRQDKPALEKSLRRAFEDQIVQKAMPKLRGIQTMGRARSECLEPIDRLMVGAGLHLGDDFANAMRVGDGAFVWNSARYLEADA